MKRAYFVILNKIRSFLFSMQKTFFTVSRILLIIMAFILVSLPFVYRYVDDIMKKKECEENNGVWNELVSKCK